jgi:kumamolisin
MQISQTYMQALWSRGTVAIVTLANFFPSDAETYWPDIGLNTKPNFSRHNLRHGPHIYV